MQPPDSRPGRWVPFDQARMILRMSEGTLRRAIKDGTVTAEQRRRNPESTTDLRMVYEVLVPDPPASATPTESAPATDPPAAISALVDALAAEREERQRLSAENGELRERIGRLEGQVIAANAERDARMDALEWTQAQLDQARADVERERARKWWKWW